MIGAELLQVQEGVEQVIAYGSVTLSAEQRRYCTTQKELLAIVRFTHQYRHYLLGRPFKLRTDHNSLVWLLNFKDPQGQLARWIEELSQYTMIVEYRKGKLHSNADALSRVAEETSCDAFRPGLRLDDLPCGGCKYCTPADQKWSAFHRDVDDAVTLAQSTETLKCAPWDSGIHSDRDEEKDLPSIIAMVKANTVIIDKDNVETDLCPVVTPAEEKCVKTVKQTAREQNQNYKEVSGCPVATAPVAGTCWGMDIEQVAQEQNKDTDLDIILAWLRDKETPSDGVLFLASPASKFYWINKERCALIDNLLHCWNKEGTNLCLVMPSGMKESALKLNHDIPLAGHQGVVRTRSRMKDKFLWFQMSSEIELSGL